MLYQTHQPLSFQFHPISSSYSSSIPHLFANKQSFASASAFLSPCLPTVQAETEMECVEAALKTSFRKDLAMKLTPQSFIDELSAFNVQNVAPFDDFSVDDLLDFSHEEEAVLEEQQDEKEDNKVVSVSVSGSPKQENPSCEISYPGFNSSVKDDFECLPSSELSVPADDLASLEWLSHFVEDSFSEYSAAFPAGILPEKPKNYSEDGPEPESPVWNQPCFKTPVPAKARSKRTRTGVRVWPLGSPTITESSSSSTSSSSSSSPSPWLIYPNLAQNLEQLCSEVKPPAKKPKKKPTSEGSSSQTPRRCSHCGVQKTPQWRTGPLGAKTLCNACGVRYKSGRLLPEYRPACSPTFSSELHSNHHRKVLEMRRKKETMGGVESGLTPPPVVPSF